MQGTIVLDHNSEAYEVEFTDETGATLDLLALRPEQFVVVWRASTQEWVSVVEQAAMLIANLPDEAAQEVLDSLVFYLYEVGRPMVSRLCQLTYPHMSR